MSGMKIKMGVISTFSFKEWIIEGLGLVKIKYTIKS